MGKRKERKSYWDEWKHVEEKDGLIIYTWPSGERHMTISAPDTKTREEQHRYEEWVVQLDAVERAMGPLLLPVLRIIEPLLEHSFWPKLRRSAPKMYVRLVMRIYEDGARRKCPFNLHNVIEDVERDLNKYGLAWGALSSIQDSDADLLSSAQADQRLAEAMDKRRAAWQRRHQKCVEFIISDESLFSAKFRAQSRREFQECLRWIKEHEDTTSTLLRQRAKAAYETLARDHTGLLRQKVTPRLRATSVFNAVIFGLVNDLMSAGSSARNSHVLTNEILKILFPASWPTRSTPDNVRQRYDYWSKRQGTKE